jgi:hypothetical protein
MKSVNLLVQAEWPMFFKDVTPDSLVLSPSKFYEVT